MKRFSRIIAVAACASWASGGLAYTFNPIGDIYWSKPVLSSLPDDWNELIIQSQQPQQSSRDSGAGSASNTDGTPCNGGGSCTYPAATPAFSNGVDLTSHGGLGFSGVAHMPRTGVNQVDHGPVFIPNTVDAPNASGVQQSCDGTALGSSNSRLCGPSSSEPSDDPATEPTENSGDGSSVPADDGVSSGSAGGFYSDPADNWSGDPSPGQEQASADVDAPATLALMVLGLATLMFYRKPIRRGA